ncbi:G-protein coupled receptor GRL101-like [Oratosquilla oratoria]|uniref:G-protein coupled receptor GRL101-like n=1 Tax=Oratosquilla oratoria TaxID=337810 RepID=UPI003F759024
MKFINLCIFFVSRQTLSEVTSRQTLSEVTSRQTLSEVTSRQTLSEVTSRQTLSEVTSRQTLSEVTLRQTLSEVTSHQTLSEVTSRQTLSEVTSRQTLSEVTSRQTLFAPKNRERCVAACLPGAALTCVVSAEDRTRDRCVAARFLCDGLNHCHNGEQLSDETGCLSNTSTWCGDGGGDAEVGERWFACRDGRCVPPQLRCDLKDDCLNGEDEVDCEHAASTCGEGEWPCRKSGGCVPTRHLCDLVFHCRDKTDEMFCEGHRCEEGSARCHTGHCLDPVLWCDHFPDCPDASDELHCGGTRTECSEGEFACASGNQCIPARNRCLLSGLRSQACADGSHLVDCRGWPCPPGMFQCRSGPCLEAAFQCDGKVDCPDSWDDEDFCAFQCSILEPDCVCHHLQVNCTGLGIEQIPDVEPQINRFVLADNKLNGALRDGVFHRHANMIYLDLSNNNLTQLPRGTFRNLWRLRILLLNDNTLATFSEGTFAGLHSLRTLVLTGNQLSHLGPFAFYGLVALATLDLSHQRLIDVAARTFVGLRNLTTLTLRGNFIRRLSDQTFTGLSRIQMLDVSKNRLDTLGARVLSTMPSLVKLVTDEWRWCCLARDHHLKECLPKADQFSSCEDLMSNGVLRVCIWVLGFVALIGNSFVIVWRSLYSSENKMHSFLIVNLAHGDLIMGIYLLIIAAVDVQYRGVYAAYETSWRTSALCQLAGFFSTFSSELSVFTLTVITVDRLLAIKFPFGVRHLDRRHTYIVMAFVWIVVALLAALPLARLDYFSNFYGRSGVCLALHITNEKPNGWEYAVFIFLVLNLISFGIIAASYALMYLVATDTRAAARTGARRSDSAMARRMSFIVATDAACWLPIIALGLASLAGIAVPPRVFSWVAVFVLPLNAAVNPVVYTLSTAPVRKRLALVHLALTPVTSRSHSRKPSGTTSLWKYSLKTRILSDVVSDGPCLQDHTQLSPGCSCRRNPSPPTLPCAHSLTLNHAQSFTLKHRSQTPSSLCSDVMDSSLAMNGMTTTTTTTATTTISRLAAGSTSPLCPAIKDISRECGVGQERLASKLEDELQVGHPLESDHRGMVARHLEGDPRGGRYRAVPVVTCHSPEHSASTSSSGGAAEVELVPLKELTTKLSRPALRRHSKRHRRRNYGDDRYD